LAALWLGLALIASLLSIWLKMSTALSAYNWKRLAINETVVSRNAVDQCWTSAASGPSYAWVVFFRTGMPTWTFLKTPPFAVRMVRTGW
jgi:hypothetical protein